jgi:DNA-binding PadR family transcriptional regulator
METLVVLYFIDLTFGSVGQGRVSRNDLARWFRVSKPTVTKFMDKMADDGLVEIIQVSSKRGLQFEIKYAMTADGKSHLDNHYVAAYDLYHIQVAKILAAIELGKNEEPEYRKITAKERRQLEAGQKELL